MNVSSLSAFINRAKPKVKNYLYSALKMRGVVAGKTLL
jgi:hypothetical protein